MQKRCPVTATACETSVGVYVTRSSQCRSTHLAGASSCQEWETKASPCIEQMLLACNSAEEAEEAYAGLQNSEAHVPSLKPRESWKTCGPKKLLQKSPLPQIRGPWVPTWLVVCQLVLTKPDRMKRGNRVGSTADLS